MANSSSESENGEWEQTRWELAAIGWKFQENQTYNPSDGNLQL